MRAMHAPTHRQIRPNLHSVIRVASLGIAGAVQQVERPQRQSTRDLSRVTALVVGDGD
jgi:hypothetical protein